MRIGNCDDGTKLKCCNCGEEHSSAFRGCEASKRAAEVQKVKVSRGISYAEAVRRETVQTVQTVQTEANGRTKSCDGCDDKRGYIDSM